MWKWNHSQEVLVDQEADDERRHIVWVAIGSTIMRCSVHSVRPLTELEQAVEEMRNQTNPMEWKSLTDLIPSKEYVDVIREEPDENNEEKVDLPTQPDASTIKPVTSRRLRFKQPEPTTSVEDKQQSMDINDYQPRSAQVDVDADLEEDDLGIGDGRTLSVGGSSSARPLLKSSASRASESVAEEPGEKRQKVTHGEDDSESPERRCTRKSLTRWMRSTRATSWS